MVHLFQVLHSYTEPGDWFGYMFIHILSHLYPLQEQIFPNVSLDAYAECISVYIFYNLDKFEEAEFSVCG